VGEGVSTEEVKGRISGQKGGGEGGKHLDNLPVHGPRRLAVEAVLDPHAVGIKFLDDGCCCLFFSHSFLISGRSPHMRAVIVCCDNFLFSSS
jgi:hypothetical protein